MNEKNLVLKAREGDAEAFSILYGLYKKKLYGYAYYKLNNPNDAEDVVQDCALTAFEQIGKLKKPEAFSSWIFKILYHACADAVKVQIRQRSTDDFDNCKGYASSVHDEIIERQELKEALSILSEDDKNIVLLSVVVGLTSKEIAKITNIKPSTVRKRQSRNLAKMRDYLS